MSRDDRDNLDAASVAMDPAAAGTKALELAKRSLALGLRVSSPATVTAYNPASQKAELLLGIVPVEYVDVPGAGYTKVPNAPVPLSGVPVAFLASNTGRVTVPLNPGDTGLVVFSDRCTDRWLETGLPLDPQNYRTHDLADGIFFPGLHPDTAPLVPPTSTVATVVDGPLVHLGVLATSPAVLGTELAQAFATYTGAVATAFTTWSGIVPPTAVSNAAFITALGTATATLALSIANWLSTKVMVQP